LVHYGSMEGGYPIGKYCSSGPHGLPRSSPFLGAPFWKILEAVGIIAMVVTTPTPLYFVMFLPSRLFRW
jgi:hypothetical protein